MPAYTSSVAKWKDFLSTRYKDQMLQNFINDLKSLYIDYTILQKYDHNLALELIESPDQILQHANDAIKTIDLPIKKELNFYVRPYNFPKHLRIRDARTKNVNKLVSIEATIQNISTISDRIEVAAFECARCKTILIVPQEGADNFIEPAYCQCNEEKKGVFRLVHKESVIVDYQKLRIQESPEDLKGDEQPRTLDLNVICDLADFVKPGERITVNGIMRSAQRVKRTGKTRFLDRYMDVISIEREEIAYEDLEITPDDIIKIKEYAATSDPITLVANCIAPWIFGLEEEKKGIVSLLFGGVKKPLPDNNQIRGDIHILWVGDPGVAKSQVLNDVAKLAPRGFYSSGLGITGAGLTAATVKDDFMGDGSFSLRAGVLALMNGGGVACIDEFGRIREEDREKMHTAMEQQKIPIDRAGFHTTLKSECSVLAAGNPINGRWDDFKEPGEQLGIDKALLTRFDIIYVTRDKYDPVKDSDICNHILATNKAGEMMANGISTKSKTLERPISLEMLKKWIAYARRTIKPVLTDDAITKLHAYYMKIRSQNGDNEFIHATARQLEGPIRISEAFARVKLSDKVTGKDVDLAIEIIEKSMLEFKDESTGKIECDSYNVGYKTDMANRRTTIINLIREGCKGTEDRMILIELVVQRAVEMLKISDKTISKDIVAMTGKEIWSPKDGYTAIK